VTRHLTGLPKDDGQLIITDRAGTPDIPKTAYQMDSIQKRLESHPDLSVDQQKDGIAMSREVAIDFVGSADADALKAARLFEFGRWEHKGNLRRYIFLLAATFHSRSIKHSRFMRL